MKYNLKKILVEIICILFMILFVYAAMSKLLIFDEFKIQIGQSPVLTSYTIWVAWTIPAMEVLISIMLAVPLLKLPGLYASFTLMVMFTAYIIIILNFSDYVPCSCGGVLEKLGWTEHLIFNMAFITLAFIGILILNESEKYKNQKHIA